jgi:hypothetical protein
MKPKSIVILAAIVLLAGAWYLFRPERLFVNERVNEALPAGGTGSVLAAGDFHGVAHATHGTATIFQMPSGSRLLRLTNFETSNGPDVRVYLIAANDANDSDTVTNTGFVELGSLKGNIGDQNYEIPAAVDLAKYQAVTIWCKRFAVNFATAPLAKA